MRTKKIVAFAGDGIGPEIMDVAILVLQKLVDRGLRLEIEPGLIGGAAYNKHGDPLPASSLQAAKTADAVLLGAVGGPHYEQLPQDKRPEAGLLRLRQELGVFANLRPIKLYPELAQISPLKLGSSETFDIMIVRELTGDLYFGKPRGIKKDRNGERVGLNTMVYHESEIRRIAEVGFKLAASRDNKLCSVDKANVLEVSTLWREVVGEVSQSYPRVELTHMLVDNAAMQLIKDPGQFDVLLTSNLFGDILSDEASMLTGSIGMLPSASIGADKNGLYEPIHGSAPDIAGQDKANPIGMILSVAMMLRHSLDEPAAAQMIEAAVEHVLKQGSRTHDTATADNPSTGTTKMADAILKRL